MPRVPYTRHFIEFPVSDRVFNDTIIKQKARFVSLVHEQDEIGSQVTVTVLVTMYANDNGDYGQVLTGPGFRPYKRDLRADNTCIVDTADGSIVAVKTIETSLEWNAKLDMSGPNCMFQGDYFELLRDNEAIKIGDLIQLHIVQANALGHFA